MVSGGVEEGKLGFFTEAQEAVAGSEDFGGGRCDGEVGDVGSDSDEAGGEGERARLARDSLEEEEGVLGRVKKVLLDEERVGFDHVKPLLGDALESEEGFHGDSYQNVHYHVVG